MKRDELEKTAKAIHDYILADHLGTWEDSQDSVKVFYRKIARWNLEIYPMKKIMEWMESKKCQVCGKKNLKSYVIGYGNLTLIRTISPHPIGLMIPLPRIFCSLSCLKKYLKDRYDPKKEGQIGGW